MVHLLIDLHRAIARHGRAAAHSGATAATVSLAALAAVGSLLLGLSGSDSAGWPDVVALTALLWVGGRIAQAAMAGEPVLRPELFALLPLPRRRLAWSLLVVGLLDPANAFLALALGAIVVRAAARGPVAAGVGVLAVVLTVVATSASATLAAGSLGPGSVRGRDLGTLVVAVAISLLAMTGTLLPSLLTALHQHALPGLSALLRILPTGWAAASVAALGAGRPLAAVAPLVGLAAVAVAACLTWPVVLARRMAGRRPRHHGQHRPDRPRRLLGTGPISAVAAKELRLWVRDPIRLTCLVIALIVGTGTCIVPQLTAHTGLLLPYGGAMTVVIAAACACNLYGNDGASLWLTILTPDSARADVRGRQLALLLAVGPYAVLSTLTLTALARQPAAWPWALGLLTAVLGGGAGLAPLASLISVQPLDAAGNPTPGWSLKIHVALLAIALTAAAPLGVLLAGGGWWAVPVGLLTGLGLAAGCGRLAITRLVGRQVSVLRAVTATT